MRPRALTSIASVLLTPLVFVVAEHDAAAQSVPGPVVVPVVTTAPTWDPHLGCLGAGWDQAALIQLPGTPGFVEVLRTATDAYFCFYDAESQNNNLPVNSGIATVTIDVGNTKSATLGTNDLSFIVESVNSAPNVAASFGPILGPGYGIIPADQYQAWSGLVPTDEFHWQWDLMLRVNVAAFGGTWGGLAGAWLAEGNYAWPSSSSNLVTPSGWGTLDFGGTVSPTPQVFGFSPNEGNVPEFMRPGTRVNIGGRFLDQVAQVFFNYDYPATVTGSFAPLPPGIVEAKILQQTSDGLVVEVPEDALTGPIELKLKDPKAPPLQTSSSFTVHSYRNQYGYRFDNWNVRGFGDTTWSDLTDVWGWDQMYTLGIFPSFEAFIFYVLTLDMDEIGGGHCFGMAFTSLRMLNGDQPLPGPFPFQVAPGNLPWDLASAGPPDDVPLDALYHHISGWHTAQYSVEALHAYLRNRTSARTSPGWVVSRIQEELSNGRPLLIDVVEGPTTGHVLVAYDLVQNPPQLPGYDWGVRLYDPNNSFGKVLTYNTNSTDSEYDPHGLAHAYLESAAVYLKNDGTWSLPGAASGGAGGVTPMLYSEIPANHPTMPGSLEGLVLIAFGSASTTQVSDDAGHTLFNADGTENTGSSGIPNSGLVPDFGGTGAPPLIVAEGAGTLHQTLHNTADGTYSHGFMGRGVAASIEGMTALAGVDDTVTMETQTGSFTFQTGAPSKPFAAKLSARVGSDERAFNVASATTYAEGGDSLRLTASRDAVAYKHEGRGTDAVITLQSISANTKAQTQFVTPTIHLRKGDEAVFTPASWDDLGNTDIEVRIKHADGCETIEHFGPPCDGHDELTLGSRLSTGAAPEHTSAAASSGGCGVARGAGSGVAAWLVGIAGIAAAARRRRGPQTRRAGH